MIRVFIPGEPMASGRGRAAVVAGRPRVFTPAKSRAWGATAAEEVRAAWGNRPPIPLGVPVRVDWDAVFARGAGRLPRSLGGTAPRSLPLLGLHRATKPDRDNLDKAILDALVRGGALVDDAGVCCGSVAKWWQNVSPDGMLEPVGVHIEIVELTP